MSTEYKEQITAATEGCAAADGYVAEGPATLYDVWAWHNSAAKWHEKSAALIRRVTPDEMDDIRPHEDNARLHRAFADVLLPHTTQAQRRPRKRSLNGKETLE